MRDVILAAIFAFDQVLQRQGVMRAPPVSPRFRDLSLGKGTHIYNSNLLSSIIAPVYSRITKPVKTAMNQDIKRAIERIIGQPARAITPLPGGMISQVLRVDLADGALVAKAGGEHDLRIEAYMLRYLRAHSPLPVPAVLHAQHDLLLMDFVEGTSLWDSASLRHLGELLAACHQVYASQYGLERDTLIGPIHQPNAQDKSWIAFFRERRLRYMTGLARESGNLPGELDLRLGRMADALEDWLIEPAQPALIHGDMWRTNVLVRDGRVAGIIDPALYFAHNEMELGYMTLFDGVGGEFFEAYQAHIPIDKDFFTTRRHIYNLYPLLVHLIIFGDKYLPPLHESLARFGF